MPNGVPPAMHPVVALYNAVQEELEHVCLLESVSPDDYLDGYGDALLKVSNMLTNYALFGEVE